ncbi:MAG TPA: 16S rRNA (uracil(1498)-N(3))-methyltransferase [Candidatus Dormibacteraeota bacterium]|nr:16S rRNA (uracil(1498)-N(3))-methyltransferase [Candidatus Dormibacteraeota bacterium]
MNLLLLDDRDFVAADRVHLTGRRLRHVREVHRAAVGDTLRVGRIDGEVGSAVVVALDDVALTLGEVRLDAAPPPPAPLRLLLALPRPKALRRVLQGAAAFGIKDIVVLNSWRVEKSFWQSPVLQPPALREQLLLGLEQGGDTRLPRVELRRRFKPFVEDELPALLDGLGLVAHPPAAELCPRAVAGHVTLAVGPEGGFIPYEVEALQRAGCRAVSLGPRPLRVEQAVPALLGRLL